MQKMKKQDDMDINNILSKYLLHGKRMLLLTISDRAQII